jgi:probable F420-dependent oxidoreductase
MDVGVALPHSMRSSHDGMKRLATTVEELGYHSVWTSEHIVVPLNVESPYPYSADGKVYWDHEEAWPEAMVTLAFLAGVTERVRLGTSIIPVMTRDPLTLAKQAATVDLVSNGRHELGLGAGWCLEEAAMLGHPTDAPKGRLAETIQILRKAWSESKFEHHGTYWDYDEVAVHPHPPQGAKLPIMVGGASPKLLQVTAELADGNVVSPGRVERLREIRDALPAEKQVTASMPIPVDADAEWMRNRSQELRGNGADRLILGIARHDQAAALETIALYAREVMPGLD